MKGQYLAVESVLTLGLGLVIAIGSITAFQIYREGLISRTVPEQVDQVESQVLTGIYRLTYTETGETTLKLPEKIGERDYRVLLGKNLRVQVSGNEYASNLSGLRDSYNFSGSSEGGRVKLFKNREQIILGSE